MASTEPVVGDLSGARHALDNGELGRANQTSLRYVGRMTKVLEKRVADLEKRLEALERAENRPQAGKPSVVDNSWLDGWVGSFKDDPDFEDAMRLGREYRERQPKC